MRFLRCVIASGLASCAVGLTLAPSALATSARATSVSANLACAKAMVSTWSLTRVARETVVVSAQATSLASIAYAATQGYGGIILFGSSAPAALGALLRSLRHLEPARVSPMVMSDDEGGAIVRFPNLVGQWPWAQVMGSTMTPAQILAQGQSVGAAMARVGLNVDLAPVADVDGRAVYPSATNPDGLRSFGGSPTKVATDVVAFATGLRRAHVVAVVKHYPGLGGSSGNTDAAPATTRPWSILRTTGLLPFRRAFAAGVDAVMLSNASVPGLTSLPAGVSPAVVAQLRHEMGFSGLIMTDALGAGAISARHWSVPQASVLALAAGVDQVLGSNPASTQVSLQTASLTTAAIVSAVDNSTLSRATLINAAAMVLATTNTLSCAT